MFSFLVLLGASAYCLSAHAQEDKSKRPSPPATATARVGGATITIDYSQPSVKGRPVWNALVPYDKVWRTGANECTTFKTDKDIMVQGKKLPAGKYGFFTIPGANEWTIIFNKVADQWGAFTYDEKQDYLRVHAKPRKSSHFNEKLEYKISPSGEVSIDWENLDVSFVAK